MPSTLETAFLVIILGMESSRICYCLLCPSGVKQLNCDWEDCVRYQRTVQNMHASLLEYLYKAQKSDSLQNVDRVNEH
jgi:hypothetical protein